MARIPVTIIDGTTEMVMKAVPGEPLVTVLECAELDLRDADQIRINGIIVPDVQAIKIEDTTVIEIIRGCHDLRPVVRQ